MTDNNQPIHADLIGKYCIVRTYGAGVFAGVLARMDGRQALVHNARRLWFWAGAASLSQLAVRGTINPASCKFPTPVSTIMLTEIIEILVCTDTARASIEAVPEWTA